MPSKLSPVKTANSLPQRQAKSSSTSEKKIVKFKNQSGKTLVGTLVAQQVPGDKKLVILCHGFVSHRESFHFPAIAQRLAQHNVSSLRFDFSGNGDSEGTFEFGNYGVEAQDIRAAVLFARKSGFKVVGLVGHSKGAGSVLLYASQNDDVPVVVNVAGRFDLSRGVKERFGEDIMERLSLEKQIPMTSMRDDGAVIEWTLTKWSLADRMDLNMAAVASKIRLSEVVTVHGTEDQVIPFEDARKWENVITSHTLVPVIDADHNFTAYEHCKAMIDAIALHCCNL